MTPAPGRESTPAKLSSAGSSASRTSLRSTADGIPSRLTRLVQSWISMSRAEATWDRPASDARWGLLEM